MLAAPTFRGFFFHIEFANTIICNKSCRPPAGRPLLGALSESAARCSAHLFVGDGEESVLGQLPHHVQVRPHVQLAADQHHLGVGTELLGLTLPLRVTRTGTGELHSESYKRELGRVKPNL